MIHDEPPPPPPPPTDGRSLVLMVAAAALTTVVSELAMWAVDELRAKYGTTKASEHGKTKADGEQR